MTRAQRFLRAVAQRSLELRRSPAPATRRGYLSDAEASAPTRAPVSGESEVPLTRDLLSELSLKGGKPWRSCS
jgi:hypothetical protein